MTQNTIFLMRHGQIPQVSPRRFVGQRDIPLDSAGKKQALNAGDVLTGLPVGRVICSGLRRTRQTAEYVALGLGAVPPLVEDNPAFMEINLGQWEGLSKEEVMRTFPGAYEARGADLANYRPLNGESFRDVQERALAALEQVAIEGGSSLIVGHAGVNRTILCGILGMPLENLFRLGQDYCCLNVLTHEHGAWRVDHVNLRIGDMASNHPYTLLFEPPF